jgi:nucleoside phosphorylase
MNSVAYTEKSWDEVGYLTDNNLILLITATDLETSVLHTFIKPINGYSSIIKVYLESYTYYIGKFGNYLIAHVQCGMGSIGRDASILTTSDSIRIIKPKLVVMIGIAFGIDKKKQKIGDVLVSESVISYNPKRVGKKETIQRGLTSPAGKIILNRFKNLRTWEHLLDGENKSELICGHLLSGEELIDNKAHRDALIKTFPLAKGGEMEGAGIFAACDGKVQWIIVKGICDFADGKKGTNKLQNQKIAVNAAISACLEVFSSKTTFNEFGINSIDNDETENEIKSIENIGTVLFDIYEAECEEYYIVRDFDNEFNRTIEQYGLWIHGGTGCGKSNLILRNIIISNKRFFQIALANCTGLNVHDFFKEILIELTQLTEGISVQTLPDTYQETHKRIISLLEKHFSNKNLIISIEEIPIDAESDYREFTEKLLSLLISKSYSNRLSNVKFVLSSINNPDKYIPLYQQKVFQQIKLIELKYWNDDDILRLVGLITSAMGITLPHGFNSKLIHHSKGSPRYIKKYFRNVFTIGKYNEIILNTLLQETDRELKY